MSKAPDFAYTPEQVKTLSETVIKDLEEKLKALHELAVSLLLQGVHADMSAAQMQLLTAKPMFIVANVDEENLKEDFPEDIIAVCAKTESELSELSSDEQREYLRDLGLTESGLERIIKEGYKIAQLNVFLVKKIQSTEEVHFFTRNITPNSTLYTDN